MTEMQIYLVLHDRSEADEIKATIVQALENAAEIGQIKSKSSQVQNLTESEIALSIVIGVVSNLTTDAIKTIINTTITEYRNRQMIKDMTVAEIHQLDIGASFGHDTNDNTDSEPDSKKVGAD